MKFLNRNVVEWCPKNVHKATGLEALAAILGLTSDQVMACGDEANDLSMIQWAGLGLPWAMRFQQ